MSVIMIAIQLHSRSHFLHVLAKAGVFGPSIAVVR